MSTPDFYSLFENEGAESLQPSQDSSPDFYSMVEKNKKRLPKKAQLVTQYGIGAAETALLPYDFAVAPLASKTAQQVPYRQELFSDIERLQEQKAAGVWSPEDQELYDSLLEQIKDPKKAEKFIKTHDIGVGGLAEKGAEKLGYDIKPEGFGENAARIGGNLLNPKNVLKLAKGGASLLTKEGRLASQWKSLANAAKGNPEKEGLLNFAKSKDLSPEAATLLLQSKGKVEALGKIAKKTKKFRGAASELGDKLGENYKELKRVGREGGYIGVKETDALANDLTKMIENMGKTLVEGPDTKAARNAIEEAFRNLENKGATIEELINSRTNLGQGINWKNIDPKGEMLNEGRSAFLRAIEKSNPSAGKELRFTDAAWRKYKNFAKILDAKQPKASFHGVTIPNFAGTLAFFAAFGTGTAVKGLVAKELIQRLSTKLLIDPRYQGLHKRLMGALQKGSTNQQKEILVTIKKMLKSDDPGLYEEMSELTFE